MLAFAPSKSTADAAHYFEVTILVLEKMSDLNVNWM